MDCFKHTALVSLLEGMVGEQESQFTYLDTHAGGGAYDLRAPEAQRLQRSNEGVRHLLQAVEEEELAGEAVDPTVGGFLAAVRQCNALRGSGPDELHLYPGSPVLALQRLRPGDRAVLLEVAADVHAELERRLAELQGRGGSREVLCADAYRWASRNVNSGFAGPGLVLVDPPYDSVSSSDKWNLFLLRRLRREWPGSSALLWYVSMGPEPNAHFRQRVAELGLGAVLGAEMLVEWPDEQQSSTTGLLLTNPPPWAEARWRKVLPELCRLLSRGARVHASASIFRL